MKNLIKMGFKKFQVLNYPKLALQFGLLSVYLKDSDNRNLTFQQLKKIVKSKKFLPLSKEEQYALDLIEMRAVNDIKGLGDRIGNVLRNTFIEGNNRQRSEYKNLIKDTARRAIKKREAIGYIRSVIGEKTGDWARDLDRISDFVLHEAYDTGRAIAIVREKGYDALVYKRVHPDACESCKELYLEDIIRWKPRIFKISELLNNGNNIGRKKNDWKPVVGATHPWCRCVLENVPVRTKWSYKTNRFVADKIRINKYDFKKNLKVKKNIS